MPPDALPSNTHMLLRLQCLHEASCMSHAAGISWNKCMPWDNAIDIGK